MGFKVGPASIEKTEWNKLRTATARLLTARGFQKSADLLTRYPFLIHVGENDFNDDFSVLYAEVGLPIYVEIEEIHRTAKKLRNRRKKFLRPCGLGLRHNSSRSQWPTILLS